MSVRSELETLLNRGKSSTEEPWWMPDYRFGKRLSGFAESIGVGYEKAKMYTGNKLDDTYDSLVNMLKVADSEEGMKLYEKKLGEFGADSTKFGGFDDNIIQAETLKMLGNQKKQMHNDFSMAIKASNEELFQSDDFLDEADDFVNIQDTMDKRGIKGSVADFLQSELANANRLRDGMVAGFQIQGGEIVGTNFRYNKGVNDKETFRKLNLYRDRLDLAVKSLAGDKMISPEEAEAIIIGDQAHYLKAKDAALRKAEKNYEFNRARVVQWSGLESTAVQNKLKAKAGETDFLNVDIDSIAEETDDATYKELSLFKKAQDWDGLIKALANEKGEYQELKNIANQNYKNWYGSEFEKVGGGLTPEDINKLTTPTEIKSKEDVKKTAEASLGITFPEKDITEEQKTKTKKIRRQTRGVLPIDEPEDKELYSSSENILEDYIKGDIDNDSIREIGGQSLVNKASRIRNVAKGQKPKVTVIPGIKTKERKPVSDTDVLKELEYGSPGDKYSWHDVVSDIYGKKGRGLSVVDDYLSGDVGIKDFKLTYRTRRNRAEEIKQKFQKLGISLEEFKKKHNKDYETLINLLGKSRNK